MKGKFAQVIERRVAGAEVVEGNADAEILKLLHRSYGALALFKQHALGDLQFQPWCLKTRLRKRRNHLQCEAAVLELYRRQVDGDLDAVRPSRGFGAGMLQY